MTANLTPTRFDVMTMFADNTAGESTLYNRLTTRRLGNGNVGLVGYGWLLLAEYNESDETVTVYQGHKNLGSATVTRWVNEVRETAGKRGRQVMILPDAATVDSPNDGAQYVEQGYVNFEGKSAQEERIVQGVIDSLRHLA